MAVLLVGITTIHALRRHFGLLAFASSLISSWLVWIGSVLAHELGHVVGARAAGLRPFLMVVGGGPSLVLRDVGGVAIDVGVLPGNGLTMLSSGAVEPRLKWRLFVAYASGPLVTSLLLALGLLAFAEQWAAYREDIDDWLHPGPVLVIVNGLLLFTSIVPLPRGSDLGTPRNDFLQLVKLPSLEPQALEGLVKVAQSAPVWRFFQLRRYQAAYDEARRVLAEHPDNWVVRLHLADMSIFARRYEDAAREYGALLDEPALSRKGVPPVAAAFVANNYAWANYMQGGDRALAAADTASAKAVGLLPKHPSIVGTRGAILVARGELREGRELLERARKGHRDARSRASNFACLGLAALAEARSDDARRYFERARRLDPDCEVLARLERTPLGVATAPGSPT
jgi:tetratricopeptide (TPR) repeat protein